MTRLLFAIPLVVLASSASAQQGQDACARDATRFCRAYTQQGDMAVLACLQQNRARISRGCDALLKSHGR